MSLKENDKSLLPGSFFDILFDQFTRAYSQNARSGLCLYTLELIDDLL